MNILTVPKAKLVQIDTKKTPVKKLAARGCDHCPSNHVKDINKVFTKLKDRQILIFTSYPGQKENEEKKCLSGSSGEFLFDELAKVGIDRKDCDVQNTVRCYPADNRDGDLYKREPKKEEIHCCSLYNDEVKAKTKSKIYILLGALTHKAILGKEYKKSKKVFWSDTLKAKVYCLAHPNYFLGGHAPQLALDEFRSSLKAIAQDIKGGSKNISHYAYLYKKKYRAIRSPEELKEVYRTLLRKAREGNRLTVDIEHDTIDDKELFLCCGFTHTPGQCDVVILDHPKARKVNGHWIPLSRQRRRIMHRLVAKILNDKRLKKAFHQGSSDVPIIERHEDVKVQGYDFDTIYAEFFVNPDRRAFGLTQVALQRYPQFGDYKTIILPECIPPDVDITKLKGLPKNHDLDTLYRYVSYHNLMHFSYLPLKKLVLRNGADCDITKRLELATKDKVSLPLLRIYRDAAFVLSDMEQNGPEFDYKHISKLEQLYPPKLEKVLTKLRLISGKKDFNPNSAPQVYQLLYEKLKIKAPDAAFNKKKKRKRLENGELEPLKAGTGKAVLEILSRKHKVAVLLQEFRRLKKIISTYITSFKNNADQNNGRLKTKWWLTGTRTGRLSSGGDKQVKESKNKNINLQNIHGDANIQNLATADKNWRKLYNALNKAIGRYWSNSLEDIYNLIAKIQAVSDKEKKKTLNDKLYAQISALKKKLYISGKWKKLARNIVLALGSICVLLGFDQGQIEVRVMAQASGDENLIRDCMSGDIHSKVGHAMTGWPIEKIKKDKKTRTLTKNIHFGILFGLGVDGLMDFIKLKDPDSTIDEEEAQRLYNNYFKAYPKVRAFITRMREFVEEHGYVENMFGFRRPLKSEAQIEGYDNDDANDDEDQSSGAFWGNQAINTPVQGAAHQLMLMAIAMLHRKKKKYKELGVPTIEVHDYMGTKTKLKNLISSFHLFKELLEKEPLRVVKKEFPHIKWKIPLFVEGKVGFRLGDSVELEEDGKVKEMHEILVDMFFESYIKEQKLTIDLRMAA